MTDQSSSEQARNESRAKAASNWSSSALTANDIFTRVLRYTGLLAVALLIVGGLVGFLVAGTNGLWSAVAAAAVAVVFSAITVGSMILAIRQDLTWFFAIVMGSWLLKFVAFVIVLLLLRDQPFIDPIVFFLTLVVALVGTAAIDAIVVMRSRVAYVSETILPPAPSDAPE
jgi:hypothetical protein